jgi:nucleoside-diphosphate-sugar epimerase
MRPMKKSLINNMIEMIEKDISCFSNQIDFSKLAHKKILLTGASGLLGIYFLASLRHIYTKLKIPLTVYTVIHSSPHPLFNTLSKEHFITVIKGDIADYDFIKSLPMTDVIIHAAGYGQPDKFCTDPIKTYELNTVGTLGLLKKLSLHGKFLFTSSAEVYTGLSTVPFNENKIGTTNTNHPRSCYIEGKRGGEAICHAYRNMGIEAKSARISLIFGPGTKEGDYRVLNMLIEKGIKYGHIQLIDHGEATRSFLYVADAVVMLWNILLEGKEAIYNVGGKYQLSIFNLAEEIGRELQVSVKKGNQLMGQAGAPELVQLDMSLYQKEFRSLLTTPFDIGLSRTIDWQKKLYLLQQCSANDSL